jgi:tRNA U34 5-carboxymethylaminomethyl modifying enzyme MnmG/GidA
MNFPGRGHIYDVAIVGAGICGTEAALACANAGLDVLLVTTILDTCYNLVGDGAVLKAPQGTFMANAVANLGDRNSADRNSADTNSADANSADANSADANGFVTSWELHRAAKFELEHTPNLHFLQSSVSALVTEGTTVTGITTWEGVPRYAKNAALCVGSFLEARLTIGNLVEHAGRLSEMSYDDLYQDLLARGFKFDSLKLRADSVEDSPGYSVDCKIFAKDEIHPVTFALNKFRNLYAAGTCAFGYLSYEEAANQGQQLAGVLRAEG